MCRVNGVQEKNFRIGVLVQSWMRHIQKHKSVYAASFSTSLPQTMYLFEKWSIQPFMLSLFKS